jgi:hypothetical protein
VFLIHISKFKKLGVALTTHVPIPCFRNFGI